MVSYLYGLPVGGRSPIQVLVQETARALDVIRTAYSMASEVMKIIFSVLHVSFNSRHYTVVIKRQFFVH